MGGGVSVEATISLVHVELVSTWMLGKLTKIAKPYQNRVICLEEEESLAIFFRLDYFGKIVTIFLQSIIVFDQLL